MYTWKRKKGLWWLVPSKEGYFETYILESNEGPARKYYKITAEGIENLNRLKNEWNQFVFAVNTFLND